MRESDIQKILPHRQPFVMVDKLIHSDNEEWTTTFHIREDNIFIENGRLREFALIENMAQSAAVGLVHNEFYKFRKEGYLVSVNKLELYKLPLVNHTLSTKVKFLHHFANMYLVRAENYCDQERLLECELKLFGI